MKSKIFSPPEIYPSDCAYKDPPPSAKHSKHSPPMPPQQAEAWAEAVQALGQASTLDPKTQALAYLAVLAAMRLESGVPFHVKTAKQLGASREEVIGAVLVGLPAAGHVVKPNVINRPETT